jgi:Pyocin activator protein PrtN
MTNGRNLSDPTLWAYLRRKALRGDLALPIVRTEISQKAQRGVHLVDLAAYIDKRRAAAVKECRQLTGQT